LKNISGDSIKCSCKKCKNKKFLNSDVVTIYLLQKEFIEKYLCWFAHGEPYVPYETMVERTIGLTCSSSNIHGVVNNNSNHYRSMVVDAMRIFQYFSILKDLYKKKNSEENILEKNRILIFT